MLVSSGARVGAANNGTSPEVGAVASIAREGVQVAGCRLEEEVWAWRL